MSSEINSVLKDEYADSLCDYQKNRINQIYREYSDLNRCACRHVIGHCPKCGAENPPLTKGGFTRNGTQMLKCGVCKKRFVETTGTLWFYSHQGPGKWADFIKCSMKGDSLQDSAALINVHERTGTRMRQKLLAFLQISSMEELQGKKLSDVVEIDEIYFHEAHKGLIPEEIADLENAIFLSDYDPEVKRMSEEEAERYRINLTNELENLREELSQRKRGISDQKACVITGVERLGNSTIKATNMAKPSSDDIRKIMPSIEDGTYAFIDGHKPYIEVLEEKNCPYTICLSEEVYDSINHLNNVNSLHSVIRERMRKYRGVSTINLNRYAAMFYYMHKYTSCDAQELTLLILRDLSQIQYYFYEREMYTVGIFDDPKVMAHRERRVSRFTQRRYCSARIRKWC